jgi:phosphomannomutase
VYLNDLTPAKARQIAAAFGTLVQQEGREERGEGREESGQWSVVSGQSTPHPSSLIPHPSSFIPNPSILLAGDGRAITAELSAAVGEGLRWSGCDVTDISPATAACLAFSVHHLQAAGGILVGNPTDQPHLVGLQFWDAGPRPLSAGGPLDAIAERYQTGVDRPARSYGALRRFQADAPYLAAMSSHYHALRPLRFVIDSACGPLVECMGKRAAAVACQVIRCRVARHDLPEQIRTAAAHFAVCVDGDGETCRVLDERGQAVPAERLLLLLARCWLPTTDAQPATILLEESTPQAIGRRIEELGGRVATSHARRADMATAMQEHHAALGGGPSGRFWHVDAGVPLPDALMTITRLLVLLSRSDEPLSAVLDREAPPG